MLLSFPLCASLPQDSVSGRVHVVEGVLVIEEVVPSDGGLYSCMAVSVTGNASRDVALHSKRPSVSVFKVQELKEDFNLLLHYYGIHFTVCICFYSSFLLSFLF